MTSPTFKAAEQEQPASSNLMAADKPLQRRIVRKVSSATFSNLDNGYDCSSSGRSADFKFDGPQFDYLFCQKMSPTW